jgi:hypothetical protein
MDSRVVPVVAPVPDVVLPSSELAAVGAAATAASGFALGRAASRLSVTSVTLLTAILLTMGVSFALGGFGSARTQSPPRIVPPRTTTTGGSEVSDPITGRAPRFDGNGDPTHGPPDRPTGPSGHHDASGGLTEPVTNTGGDPGTPVPVDPGGVPGNQGGSPGDQGGGSGDQGGGQGDQGGGSGGQGGGSGDQGGGQGDQGGQGGSQGDQGGTQGDQGGTQGDQGSSGQGDQGATQGTQGDQGN